MCLGWNLQKFWGALCMPLDLAACFTYHSGMVPANALLTDAGSLTNIAGGLVFAADLSTSSVDSGSGAGAARAAPMPGGSVANDRVSASLRFNSSIERFNVSRRWVKELANVET